MRVRSSLYVEIICCQKNNRISAFLSHQGHAKMCKPFLNLFCFSLFACKNNLPSSFNSEVVVFEFLIKFECQVLFENEVLVQYLELVKYCAFSHH